MSKHYKITIIGSGNVAWHLTSALESGGHVLQEIYSRNIDHAKLLTARSYQGIPQNHLDFSDSQARLFFIAVSDSAITEVMSKIKIPPGSFIAHTSGSIPLDALERIENHAVFYPLQTISKTKKINYRNIPICLEASNENTSDVFEEVARSISDSIYFMDSDKRKAVHLSAVFACNFTNHLLGIASYILKSQDIQPSIIHPLIAETINKAMEQDPFTVQTGPGVRNDTKIIEEHLEMLEDIPLYKEIYEAITNSIVEQNSTGS